MRPVIGSDQLSGCPRQQALLADLLIRQKGMLQWVWDDSRSQCACLRQQVLSEAQGSCDRLLATGKLTKKQNHLTERLHCTPAPCRLEA